MYQETFAFIFITLTHIERSNSGVNVLPPIPTKIQPSMLVISETVM